MARKTARPGRTLVVFLIGLGVAFGLVAIGGTWKPELGLDLQGGTSIRLTAEGEPQPESMEEARKIIDQRVNGSGVAEAEVTVQGNRTSWSRSPARVARTSRTPSSARPSCGSDWWPALTGSVRRAAGPRHPTPTEPEPGEGVVAPTEAPTPEATPAPVDPRGRRRAPTGPRESGTSNRAPVAYGDDAPPSPSESPRRPDDPSARTPTADPWAKRRADDESDPAPEGGKDVGNPLTWMDNPNQEAIDAFNAFECPTDGSAPNVDDDPDKPLVTCGTDDEAGLKYLLSAAMIEGTELNDAAAEIPQSQVNYVVTLEFNGDATEVFADISRALVGTEKQFAIVLDGQVLSAPTMDALIRTVGPRSRATSRRRAPRAWQPASSSARCRSRSTRRHHGPDVGPSLAGDQLSRRPARRRDRSAAGDALLPDLLPRPRTRRHRLAAGRRGGDVRHGAAAERDRELHAHPAGHRRPDRGRRHHG